MPQDSSYSDMYRQSVSKKLGKSLDSEEKELKKCGCKKDVTEVGKKMAWTALTPSTP